jgi:hypothetical protein
MSSCSLTITIESNYMANKEELEHYKEFERPPKEEKKENENQKVARVLRDAYERLSAAGFPEMDRELKDLVDDAEKAAGVKFRETKTEPPVAQDLTWQGEPVPPLRQWDVTRYKDHPIHKTLQQIKEEKEYKDAHRGEISQQKYEEAIGKDYRGRVKSEAEEEEKKGKQATTKELEAEKKERHDQPQHKK